MPSTTEIVTLNLVAGSEIGNPDNQAAHVLKDCFDELMQQDGMQQIQFGQPVENPEQLALFQNWDTIDHHKRFQDSDAYQPFVKKFGSILTGDINIIHADLKPEGGLTAALSAPVTEVATFYFDGGPPANAAQGVDKCLEALRKEGHNLYGWSYGTTYEEIEKDGVKGKGAVLTIGWDTVEAHMEARKGQAFKENIDSLRNGAKAIAVHHIPFMHFQK